MEITKREKIDRKVIDELVALIRMEIGKPIPEVSGFVNQEAPQVSEYSSFSEWAEVYADYHLLQLRQDGVQFVPSVARYLRRLSDHFKNRNHEIPWQQLEVICANFLLVEQLPENRQQLHNMMKLELVRLKDDLEWEGFTAHQKELKRLNLTSRSVFTKPLGFRN